MLPYVEYPVLDLGFYRIGAFPVLVGAAIVAEFQIVLHRAPGMGIPRATASSLAAWAIFWGLLGAHVFDVVAYYPEKLAENPLELFRVWGGLSSMGGMLGGLLGLFLVMRRRGMSGQEMRRFVECLLYALPFTLAIGRAGCALQHDHLGIASTHWLAVAFPEGPRFDLGLLELLYLLGLCALTAALGRRPRPLGFFSGLFFACYGPVRFALDLLRIGDARYLGLTPAQYLSVLATAAGLALLVAALRRGEARPG